MFNACEYYGKALALGFLGYSDKEIQKELQLSDDEMKELLELANDN